VSFRLGPATERVAKDLRRERTKTHERFNCTTGPFLTTWSIDPVHSIAEFKVKHMMISSVKGHFSKINGSLTIDESDHANSRVEASIETASIETRDGQRDGHLKSEDFFHVEKFPTLSFQSTSISRVADGELSVEGDLTIRGVKRKLVFAQVGGWLRAPQQYRLERGLDLRPSDRPGNC
jgi:polyisoprenoid-binding protein YceI